MQTYCAEVRSRLQKNRKGCKNYIKKLSLGDKIFPVGPFDMIVWRTTCNNNNSNKKSTIVKQHTDSTKFASQILIFEITIWKYPSYIFRKTTLDILNKHKLLSNSNFVTISISFDMSFENFRFLFPSYSFMMLG